MSSERINKYYVIYEIHSNLDPFDPVHRLLPTNPHSGYFDNKAEAEAWVAEHSHPKVDYTIQEVYRKVY